MPDIMSFIRPDKLWQSVGLRAGQTVVHLGSGAGFYLIPAAHVVGKGGSAIGIDILPDMLSEAESRAQRAGVGNILVTKRANLEVPGGSGLKDNSADWVLLANILHLSNPAPLFTEATRIVAANGRVLVVTWDVGSTPFGPPASKRIAKPDMIQYAQAAGLAVEKELNPSPYHYGLVLKKTQ